MIDGTKLNYVTFKITHEMSDNENFHASFVSILYLYNDLQATSVFCVSKSCYVYFPKHTDVLKMTCELCFFRLTETAGVLNERTPLTSHFFRDLSLYES